MDSCNVGWMLSSVTSYPNVASPSRLPVVIVGNRGYYFDQKLAQLRRVDCPFDYIELSEAEVGFLNFRLVVSNLSSSE